MDNFSKKITTRIFKEDACETNPYLADKTYIHGYELTKLIEKKSFTDVLFLLFRGELPTEKQQQLLDRACVALIHIGIRHPATRAAMIAGVGKTKPEHILPIGSLVNSGAFDGAVEVSHCVDFITKHQDSSPKTVAKQAYEKYAEKLSAPGDKRIVPGFGSTFGDADIYCSMVAESVWQGYEGSKVKTWTFEFIHELNKLDDTLGWTRVALAASVLKELGFNERNAIGVYQLMTAPGLVAQGMEQTYNPIFNFPILQDDQYELE